MDATSKSMDSIDPGKNHLYGASRLTTSEEKHYDKNNDHQPQPTRPDERSSIARDSGDKTTTNPHEA
jgi:hypothetical protein